MAPEFIDLDNDSRIALEFDALLELVATYAVTEGGESTVLAIRPAFSEETVEKLQKATREAVDYVERVGKLLAARLPDPGPALDILEVEGVRVEAGALRDLSMVLSHAGDLRLTLMELSDDDYLELRELGEGIPDLRNEAGTVLDNIDPDGTISDGASRELRRIRRAAARIGSRLRGMLESYLHGPEAGAVIQDEFITQRNGRYVIPVRADAPRKVRGIVHASSSSGATLFVEPLRTVDMNNELVRLMEQEIEEQDRILTGWAGMFRARLVEVREAAGRLARVDALQARALFGLAMEGCTPRSDPGGSLLLDKLRHPLLDRRLREEGSRAVPFDLALNETDRILMISGPNAGGKTVALKTLGLAVLCAQSGIPVVACKAVMPLYAQVRADIGDHQSIDADLSTFSAHVKAVARFTREARLPALLLFDEIGTGTEPTEGAALAQAVLESLLMPGITAVVTTHHGALKAWAFTETGAVSAAMEFDTDSMRPTYRIIMGAAGVSAGLDIAGRMGLTGTIVDRARDLLGSDARRTEEYLDRIRNLVDEMEKARLDLDRERDELARIQSRRREELRRETERIRGEAELALEKALQEFRDRGMRELSAIRDRRQRETARREREAAERRLKASVRQTAASVVGVPPEKGAAGDGEVEPALEPGRRVLIRSLDREGEVVRVRGDKVEVRLGTVGFTVASIDVVPVEGGRETVSTRKPGQFPPRPLKPGSGGNTDDLGESPPLELFLLGKTVEEALSLLDKYLDDTALGGYPEVRVIHGHGTGRLRKAVRRYLSDHIHVASHRPGKPAEGGNGATMVRLK